MTLSPADAARLKATCEVAIKDGEQSGTVTYVSLPPDVVLALLAALEQQQQRIAELEAIIAETWRIARGGE